MIHLWEILEHAKQIYSDKKQISGKEVTKKGHEGTFGDDRNILYLDCGGRNKSYTFIKIHWTVNLK